MELLLFYSVAANCVWRWLFDNHRWPTKSIVYTPGGLRFPQIERITERFFNNVSSVHISSQLPSINVLPIKTRLLAVASLTFRNCIDKNGGYFVSVFFFCEKKQEVTLFQQDHNLIWKEQRNIARVCVFPVPYPGEKSQFFFECQEWTDAQFLRKLRIFLGFNQHKM